MIRKTRTTLAALVAAGALVGVVHATPAQAAIQAPPLHVQAVMDSTHTQAEVTVQVASPWRLDPWASCSSTTHQLLWDDDMDARTSLYQAPAQAGESMQVSCPVQRKLTISRLVKQAGRVTKGGARWTSRTSGAYSSGGNCNWSVLSYGQLTTCLFAHASLSYTLTLPKGATFQGVTHKATAGIAACRNPSWTVRHAKGTRTWRLAFFHGSRSGFSQCVVEHVGLAYTHTKRVYSTSTIHRTASTDVVVAAG